MARKKSETPQGDGAPEPNDEAAGVATPATESASEPGPAPEASPGSPAQPWDPEIVPPSAAPDLPPEEQAASAPAPEEIAAEPAPAEDPLPADAVALDTAAEREEAARDAAHEPIPVVESVEEPHEQPHDEPHEEEAGWSLAGRALAVLCLLLAGAGLGIWAAPRLAPMLPAGMAPVAKWLTPGQAEAEAEIAALAAKVDGGLGGLESRLAALPASADIDTRIGSAVGDAQAKLSAEIEAARAAGGSVDLTAVNQKLAALEAALAGQATELGALKEQIAGTAGQLSDEALGRIDAYKGEVEALRGETGSVRDAVSGFATRLDAVEARAGREVEAAQAKVTEIQQQSDTRLGAAAVAADVARIRAAIAGGQPFAQPLAALAGQDGATPPEGLSAAAESGVATLSSLRESYPDAAHAAIRASIMASAGGGVLARSRAFLEAQVSSRSLTPQTGQGTDAVLSRMEDRLRQDDLDGLLAEAERLPSEAAAAMGDWLAAARKRAAAMDGLATLDASLTKTN